MKYRIQSIESNCWLGTAVDYGHGSGEFTPWVRKESEGHQFDSSRAARNKLIEMGFQNLGLFKVTQVKPVVLPDEVWVMGYHFSTMHGSVCHVHSGDQMFGSQEECQSYIDNMRSWIGMGDRTQYRPVRFVKKEDE